ncbi:hypothetical protein ACFU98_41835 [Streptomyces sp. NPDC057575]|uniref:hypothetical protein n=1 Tax=unclassified Streptomyces TaxID=2593676 RepID=UPI0036BDC5FB
MLAHANREFALNGHSMEVLLANEVEYVRRVAEAGLREDPVDDKLLRTLVTVQFPAGAHVAQDGQAPSGQASTSTTAATESPLLPTPGCWPRSTTF